MATTTDSEYMMLTVDISSTCDRYDMFSKPVKTGATSKVSLCRFIIDNWKDYESHLEDMMNAFFSQKPQIDSFFSTGYENLFRNYMLKRLDEDDSFADYLLERIQSHPTQPVFFLKESEHNPYLIRFMLSISVPS